MVGMIEKSHEGTAPVPRGSPGMSFAMHQQMKTYAKEFCPCSEDVQAYWSKPPSVLKGVPSHKKHRPVKDDSNEDSTLNSTKDFGTYIEACIYGSDLSAFLEGTHMEDAI